MHASTPLLTSPGLRRIDRRGKPSARAALCVAGCISVVLALLLTAVTAAVGFGGLAGLGGLGGGNELDYARGPLGEFFPLTDSFVEDTLGPNFSRTPVSVAIPAGFGTGSSSTSVLPGTADGSREDVPPPDEAGADIGNDAFADAYSVRGLPFTTRASDGGTREPNEPGSCEIAGGTRWYRFTPRFDADLIATTSGSSFATAIAVFTGGPTLGKLKQVACNNSTRGESVVTFDAAAGETYWFQVTKGVTGAVVFGLDLRGTTTLLTNGEVNAAPSVSADGRYAVFLAHNSPTSNPTCRFAVRVPAPCQQVYVRDLRTDKSVLVSTPDGEVAGNQDSGAAVITPNGRYVAFYSLSSNLVDFDNNANWDAFVRDLTTQTITRISVTSEGDETHETQKPNSIAISDDGRYVAFESGAPELVEQPQGGDPAGCCREVFIHDTATGQTQLVSTDEQGNPDPDSYVAGLSGDGQRVAFVAQGQVYVSHWKTRQLETASVGHTGYDVTGSCPSNRCLSADGRFVVFQSAEPAVADDTNGELDIFVRDLVDNRTIRVSVSSSGVQSQPPPEPAPFDPNEPNQPTPAFVTATISPDGRFVAFSSNASDLVPGDSNNRYDVFLHDLRRRTTTRVSVLDDGSQSNSGVSYQGSVSNRARTVIFTARAFTAQDGETTYGVYARERPGL